MSCVESRVLFAHVEAGIHVLTMLCALTAHNIDSQKDTGGSSNPWSAKLNNLNFHPLEVVFSYRDPQLQVGEN